MLGKNSRSTIEFVSLVGRTEMGTTVLSARPMQDLLILAFQTVEVHLTNIIQPI